MTVRWGLGERPGCWSTSGGVWGVCVWEHWLLFCLEGLQSLQSIWSISLQSLQRESRAGKVFPASWVACIANSWVSQMVFSTPWNPNVCSDTNEGMALLVRAKQAGRKRECPSLVTLYRLPMEGMAQMFFLLKRYGLKVYLHTSKIWIKSGSSYFRLSKILHMCGPCFIFGF